MYLAAGRLRHLITIKRSVDTPDGHGGFVTTWVRVAQVAAEVINLNGREAVISNALQGVSSYRITIRWRGGVKPEDQIDYDGVLLNVRSVDDPDGSRVALQIFADNQSVQA